MRISQIDLHGLTYDEVERELENKVILRWNEGMIPIYNICGNSQKMRELVKNILMNWKVEDTNQFGRLIIRE